MALRPSVTPPQILPPPFFPTPASSSGTKPVCEGVAGGEERLHQGDRGGAAQEVRLQRFVTAFF